MSGNPDPTDAVTITWRPPQEKRNPGRRPARGSGPLAGRRRLTPGAGAGGATGGGACIANQLSEQYGITNPALATINQKAAARDACEAAVSVGPGPAPGPGPGPAPAEGQKSADEGGDSKSGKVGGMGDMGKQCEMHVTIAVCALSTQVPRFSLHLPHLSFRFPDASPGETLADNTVHNFGVQLVSNELTSSGKVRSRHTNLHFGTMMVSIARQDFAEHFQTLELRVGRHRPSAPQNQVSVPL